MVSQEKFKIYSLFLIAVAHILISLFTIIPGYLSIDEVTYHMMAKNFSESGGLEIENGYREYPSPELESKFIFARNGRLVSQYPYLYPILCNPFYRTWGYPGLFFINVMAFLGIVALCYAIAQKLFNNRNLALNSCFIFVLATFSWEYSQAAWPHATATLFLMAAFYIYICSFYAKTTQIAFSLALASGLVTGFAVGIRLDSIFVLPCLIIPFLFLKPWRPWLALAVCIGALPGLSILSATNYVKFGVLSLLSYGRSIESSMGLSEIKRYLPFAGLGIVTFVILWVLTRYPVASGLKRYKRPAIIAAILLIVVLAMIPQVRNTVGKPLNGAYQLIVDLRIRDLDIKEGGLSRSQGGGMVYIHGLKKSLLQSCPYLVVLLLPFLKIVRLDKEYMPLILLFLIPVVFTGFYSYHNAWHGGLCLNLRYFIPILPFTSILSAYAWRELPGNLNWQWSRISLLIGLLTGFIFLFLFQRAATIDQQEFPVLTVPLLLALLLIILLIIRIKFAEFNRYLVARTTVAIFFMAMVWSGLVAFLYDYPLACRFRQYNFNVADRAAKVVGLIERGRFRIANPYKDKFQDFPALAAFHLQKGHPVYAAFDTLQWEKIQERGLVDSFNVVPLEIYEHCILFQLIAKSDS
jgi:4-amino-4-deoxy-L-arabinose transferase-like glycosyltransferase